MHVCPICLGLALGLCLAEFPLEEGLPRYIEWYRQLRSNNNNIKE